MQSLFLIALCVFGVCQARPQAQYTPYQGPYIVKYDHDVDDSNGYKYKLDVQTSDQFSHYQTGEILNQDTENEELSVKGQYSYIGPDGVTYTVIYTADSNGFQAEGDHIPTSKKLGIPSAALASLAG